jgi:uncharacterized protein YecE (DUF72 family)
MPIRVGTCGWQYDDWRDSLYPAELAKTRWLAAYSQTFDTVECDNAFYRLPARQTFEKWADQLPGGFLMSVKASRFLTHIKRLKDPDEPVKRLLDACDGLGDRLGPVLVQLPPTMKVDGERLRACLRCFPPRVKVAVEPRHDSWWTDEVREILTKRGAALVWSDRLRKPQQPLWRTADWGYLRLHQGRLEFPPDYHPATLRRWLRLIRQTWTPSETVFVYFNNDPGAAAVRNARAMLLMLGN